MAAVAVPGLERPTEGGEDCLTLDWKLCPPHVLTMARLKKGRRCRGWGKRGFRNDLE